MNSKQFLKIEGEDAYVKDPMTNAILNTDLAMLADVRYKRRSSKQLENLKEEINILKNEIRQIKSHLKMD